jgi:hypothetical protein
MNGLTPAPIDIANMLLNGECTKEQATQWLETHNSLHARLTTMPIESDRAMVLLAVMEELSRQDAQWGPQDHPSVDPILVATKRDAQRMTEEYEIPSEARAKFLCAAAAKNGMMTWGHIAVEELSESISAFANEEELLVEVVQLAAVCINWAQCVRRRLRQANKELSHA